MATDREILMIKKMARDLEFFCDNVRCGIDGTCDQIIDCEVAHICSSAKNSFKEVK